MRLADGVVVAGVVVLLGGPLPMFLLHHAKQMIFRLRSSTPGLYWNVISTDSPAKMKESKVSIWVLHLAVREKSFIIFVALFFKILQGADFAEFDRGKKKV